MKISEVSIKRPVFATMMIGALLVIGAFSYYGLPVELMPNVDFPFVIVQTVYPGASAESVETDVTKNIEEVINQISGVRHIQSVSREGFSQVFVEFQLEKEGAEAAQDVREKVATIRGTLPEDIEDPIITQFDNDAFPILSVAITGSRSLRDVTQLAKDRIKPRLEIIPGIGNVEIVGGYEREILIGLDPQKMESFGIAIDDVTEAVAAANMEVPGGRIDESRREYLVRLMGRLGRVADFDNIIVKNVAGTPVYLSQIAAVSDTIAEQRSLSRYNGTPSIGLSIIKQSGANVVEMAEQARQTIADLRAELPPDIKMDIVSDNSTFITDSIHEILFNIRVGTLLAVLVIFLFLLDFRPTIITGLSIPISIIATFTLLKFLGFTINIMTLLGLSLSVGILIDDAIVVIENIYRHLSEGKSPWKAAFEGTKEIGLAVMATTFTIMVVFLPVAFMEGIVGRFFYQFGMTVAFAVLISLLVAFSLTPMLSSRWLKKNHNAESQSADPARKPSGLRSFWQRILGILGLWNRTFDATKPSYERLLAFSLRHRWLVMLVAVAAFAGALVLVPLLGVEFFPRTDEGQMIVTVDTPPGTTLQETAQRMTLIEDIVREMPEVTSSLVTIGAGNSAVTQGSILFLLTDASERELSALQVIDSVRGLLTTVPGIKFSVGTEEHRGGGGKPIVLSIRGDDRDELTRLAHRVQDIAGQVYGAIDVDNTLEEGKPEVQIDVDRKAADDLGLSLAVIPLTVRHLVEGDVVTRYKDGDEEYDVRVKLDQRFRSSADQIGRILVKSDKKIPGQETFLVPLDRVARLNKQTSIGEFRRFDRQSEVRVNANVLSGSFAGNVTTSIMEEVSQVPLPPGYSITPTGEQEWMVESFINIFKALALAIIFIYLVLASQYESFWDPLSIMFSLPLSLVGAILGLLLTGSSISIMSLIGIVMLMGLVTKNAILLIDFVKQQRRKGVPRFDAVLIAGPIRLRPILMTTFATVFGMLPLALGIGPGAELRAPMARAAIGGIISSTLLTLVVVPIVYTLIDDFVGLFRRLRKVETAVRDGTALQEQVDEQFNRAK
ncbi:MAG: efflux RND transporter permease subunit [Candidatus Zixiibacteriota bacterium]|nr:MAG: efflux RND transporter permease subunit [candidate division Zixibacteria bacterium]